MATVLRSRADPKMKQIAFVRELRKSAVLESCKVHHFWKVIVGLDIKVQAYNEVPGKHEMPGVGLLIYEIAVITQTMYSEV